jgi:STE24 endopeptidase
MAAIDPAAETAALLATLPPDVQAKAVAYTHGQHWNVLWGFLVAALVAWLIVRTGVLSRIRDRLERGGRRRPVMVAVAAAPVYLLLSALLSLPWTIWHEWWYEKSFGLTSQPLGGFLGDQLKGLIIGLIVGTLFALGLYALIKRSPRRWWLWGAAFAAAFTALMSFAGPPLIEPLFNTYKPAPAGPIRDAVVELGRKTGTPTDKIFIYDGSRQSNRYTANVAGLGSSARVAMSDVMFKKGADLPQVRGVVGHEMGHYVHQHQLIGVGLVFVLGALAFWLADRLFPFFARLLGSDAKGIGDAAGLPALAPTLSVLGLLGMPLTNTIARSIENDADTFSLQHANEPDGLARALVLTAEYRAPSPGVLEEIVFYDHPSVSHRVRKAMDWKAVHPASAPRSGSPPAQSGSGQEANEAP